jgi:predicted nucleotidyltransferase
MSRIEYPAHFSASLREQLDAVVVAFLDVLESRLTGVYLHGSLAMGCFNADLSDIDLLVRVRGPFEQRTRRRIVSLLLELSGRPSPIELSILSDADLFPWSYPTPYTFHFSEDWRQRFEAGDDQPAERLDPDLAAHITVLHARGLTLFGEPLVRAFPGVPREHFRDSLFRDHDWALERLNTNPVYAILNTLRLLRYLADGAITSKCEAGEWALNTLPVEVHQPIDIALAWYRGRKATFDLSRDEIEQFVVETSSLIRLRASGGHEVEHEQ